MSTHPYNPPEELCQVCGGKELDHDWTCEKHGQAGVEGSHCSECEITNQNT